MKNAVIILVGTGVFAGGLAAAGALTTGINRDRRELNLTVSDEVYDLPPDMAVAQAALGTFRGVAVNALWQRAESLKTEGKFYEAVQLGELITRLQPRFPQVWEFVSWNQAYNISVATHTPEERWYWVKSGINLLQNKGKGIDANPNDLPLYQQLGWIYFHKVGGFQDDMSWYYKQQLADQWHAILGASPTDRDEYLAWLKPVVDAPESVDGLSGGVRRLADWLTQQNRPLDYTTLRALTVPVGTEEVQVPVPGENGGPESTETVMVPVAALKGPEWATREEAEALLAFLRRQALTADDVNMSPRFMYELAERFGPIDYRHPASHALYWSALGIDRVREDRGRSEHGILNTRRNILNALMTLAKAGQVVYRSPLAQGEQAYISYLPQWPFYLSYDRLYQSMKQEVGEEEAAKIETQYGAGYRNHMDGAIVDAYLYGETAVATQLLDQLNADYRGQEVGQRYAKTLDEFAIDALQETIENPDQARTTMAALLTSSLTFDIVYNDPQRAAAQYAWAERLYGQFRALYPNPSEPIYQEVPAWPQMLLDAKGNFLLGNAGKLGQQAIPLDLRAAVYQNYMTAEERSYIFANFGEALHAQVVAQGINPEEVFPTPAELRSEGRAVGAGAGRATNPNVDRARNQPK